MPAFFQEALMPLNLPFTVLLGLAALYWLTVIIGAADLDFLPEFDADADGLPAVFSWLHFDDMPAALVVSVIAFLAWAFSMCANHFLNPDHQTGIGLAFAAVNLILALLFSRWIFQLIIRFTGPLRGEDSASSTVMYREGVVITSEVTDTFGQIRVDLGGAPATVNARTAGGPSLKKGDRVLIYDQNKEKALYFVEKYSDS